MWSITRRILFIALLVLGGLLGASPRNAAADVPLLNAQTSFQVINLGTAPANCTYDIYSNAGGAASFSQAIASTIPVNGSVLVYTGAAANGGTLIPAGVNSGVVSCDQEVSAVVVFQNDLKRDAYVATKTPANTMYVPVAYKNYYDFSSSIRVQNTSATAQTVAMSYYAPNATTPTTTKNVALAANGSASIDQSTIAELANGVSYSVKLVGTAPIAVNVAIFGVVGRPYEPQLYAYNGFAAGDLKVYTPVVLNNYYGFNTATTVLNVGNAVATVKRTYSNGQVDNFTLQPNASNVMLDFNSAKLPKGNFLYSSVIESTQPVVVVVNQSSTASQRATSYAGLPSNGGATTVFAPSVVKRFYGYNSSIACQNVGAAATSVSVQYTGSTNVPTKQVIASLAPGAVGQIYQPSEVALPNGFSGSAVVTASQNLVCVVNQDQNEAPYATQVKDVFASYEGIIK
jgi:hypothetical protein